jgi:hypothetical protein
MSRTADRPKRTPEFSSTAVRKGEPVGGDGVRVDQFTVVMPIASTATATGVCRPLGHARPAGFSLTKAQGLPPCQQARTLFGKEEPGDAATAILDRCPEKMLTAAQESGPRRNVLPKEFQSNVSNLLA